ncbi:MAG TPA: hypothetical protein VLA90_06190, partial [Actinomycetota bacterium]|nr:hypothetical protein [Actinomycetota bacterium]
MSERLPEQLERAAAEEKPVVAVAPSAAPVTPVEWLRGNLFSSPWNGVLTIVVAGLVGFGGFLVLRWAFVTADWDVVKANLRLYLIGRFPLDEAWRVWASAFLVATLAGSSWGAVAPRLTWTPRTNALRAAIAILTVGFLLFALEGARIWVLVLGLVVVVGLGVAA